METYLVHHGILGQKWGVRRYQNADGTLTEAGKKKYSKKLSRYEGRSEKAEFRSIKRANKAARLKYKGEKIHQLKDIDRRTQRANRLSKKYELRANKYRKKADKSEDESETLRYNKKYAINMLRSQKYENKSNMISRTAPYGKRSISYLKRADAYKYKEYKQNYKKAVNDIKAQKVKNLMTKEINDIGKKALEDVLNSSNYKTIDIGYGPEYPAYPGLTDKQRKTSKEANKG